MIEQRAPLVMTPSAPTRPAGVLVIDYEHDQRRVPVAGVMADEAAVAGEETCQTGIAIGWRAGLFGSLTMMRNAAGARSPPRTETSPKRGSSGVISMAQLVRARQSEQQKVAGKDGGAKSKVRDGMANWERELTALTAASLFGTGVGGERH